METQKLTGILFTLFWNFGQIFGQIFDQIFGQIFDQVFDQIVGQGFDQGFGEGKKHRINTVYSTTRPTEINPNPP